jgi:hypothetical protein
MPPLLAAAASPADLFAAHSQMALSLGWHIVVACLGVGFPALVLLQSLAERGDKPFHGRFLALQGLPLAVRLSLHSTKLCSRVARPA